SYHFCLPHGSLRQPLSQPVPTNGTGVAQPRPSRTPAMAAGLTDHGWALPAVLLYRVLLWPPSQTGSKSALVEDRMGEGCRVLRGRPRGVHEGLKTGCEWCSSAD